MVHKQILQRKCWPADELLLTYCPCCSEKNTECTTWVRWKKKKICLSLHLAPWQTTVLPRAVLREKVGGEREKERGGVGGNKKGEKDVGMERGRKEEMRTKSGRKEYWRGRLHPCQSSENWALVWSVTVHVVNSFTDVHLCVRVSYPSHLLQSPWRQALGAGRRPCTDHHPLFFFFLREKRWMQILGWFVLWVHQTD